MTGGLINNMSDTNTQTSDGGHRTPSSARGEESDWKLEVVEFMKLKPWKIKFLPEKREMLTIIKELLI